MVRCGPVTSRAVPCWQMQRAHSQRRYIGIFLKEAQESVNNYYLRSKSGRTEKGHIFLFPLHFYVIVES